MLLLVKFEDWNLKLEATGGIYIERGGGVKGVRMGHTQFEGWGVMYGVVTCESCMYAHA